MSRRERSEDEIILALMERDPLEAPEAGTGAEEGVRRAYLELLGLLPYELEQTRPSPELKGRLWTALEAGEGASGSPGAPADEMAAAPSIAAASGAPASPRSGWLLALAASLFLALGLCGWLFSELGQARDQIAALRGRVETISVRQQELQAARERLVRAADTLTMVTTPGIEACVLRPVGSAPPQPVARGLLYIAADHQHWYLRLTGLDPAPRDHVYRVWFRTGAGPVPAGAFHTAGEGDVELDSPSMPSGTNAILVTLEPADDAAAPSGPTILMGDDVMTLL